VNILNITTDKVYENKEWSYSYRESDILGGVDPYSASKTCSELITKSYSNTYFTNDCPIKTLALRAGNVIGGGDFSKDRIMVDLTASIFNQKDLDIRNPDATRPWQNIFDLLYGYLLAAKYLENRDHRNFDSFNFSPLNDSPVSVREICDKCFKIYPDKKMRVKFNPDPIKETQSLQLNAELAQNVLGWKNLFPIQENLQVTLNWYHQYYTNNQNIKEYSISSMKDYFKKAQKFYQKQ